MGRGGGGGGGTLVMYFIFGNCARRYSEYNKYHAELYL